MLAFRYRIFVHLHMPYVYVRIDEPFIVCHVYRQLARRLSQGYFGSKSLPDAGGEDRSDEMWSDLAALEM